MSAFRLPAFPHRTALTFGALALLFLVGASAVRFAERPPVSDQARLALDGLAADLSFAETQFDETVTAMRDTQLDLDPRVASLETCADDIARTAAALHATSRGVRGDARVVANAAADRAVQAATATRTAARLVTRYAAGEATAADAVSGIQSALDEIGAARQALAPVMTQ